MFGWLTKKNAAKEPKEQWPKIYTFGVDRLPDVGDKIVVRRCGFDGIYVPFKGTFGYVYTKDDPYKTLPAVICGGDYRLLEKQATWHYPVEFSFLLEPPPLITYD